MAKNYYLILGVAPGASGNDIKSAFRRRAMELHPDTSGMESGPFVELQEAYGVLSDPQRRRLYDCKVHTVATRLQRRGLAAEPLVRNRSHRGPFRPPAPSWNSREIPLAEIFKGESPTFDELFDHLWGNLESLSRTKAETLESLTVEVVITQEEARSGGRVQVDIPARATCPACGGHGAVGFHKCWRCEGLGAFATEYPVEIPYPPGIRDGCAVRIALDRLGIENLYLTVLFRVSNES